MSDDYFLSVAHKKALAEAYDRTNRLNETVEIYGELIILEDGVSSKKELIRLHLWNDDPEEAKRIIKLLLEKYPEDEEIKLLWAKTLHFTGESENASRVLELFLKEKDEK